MHTFASPPTVNDLLLRLDWKLNILIFPPPLSFLPRTLTLCESFDAIEATHICRHLLLVECGIAAKLLEAGDLLIQMQHVVVYDDAAARHLPPHEAPPSLRGSFMRLLPSCEAPPTADARISIVGS